MTVNIETLNGMIRFFRDDNDTLETIAMALETFESYHQAIYRLEITRRLKTCGALDGSDYREQFEARDATRANNHNALLGQVNMLNRLANEAGLPPFYDGEVSEEELIRRQVADAILEFVRQVIVERI